MPDVEQRRAIASGSHAPTGSYAQAAGLLSAAKFWSIPACALISAQALAAFADTALLLVAIMTARTAAAGDAAAGLLQQLYVLPFLVFAPWAGAIVGTCPKRRIMLAAGAVKFCAAAALALGASPLPVVVCVGLGAAVYSPAKYGLLVEVFHERQLVMANAAIEGSSIVMLVMGTVASGLLTDSSPRLALGVILAVYLASMLCATLVPSIAAERRVDWGNSFVVLRGFRQAASTLFGHGEARFSLLGTSLLLASATTLRLLLLAWVPAALAINGSSTPAMLMGVSAVGMVVGALAAGRMASLANLDAVLVPGLIMGVLIAALAIVTDLSLAFIIAFAIGACAGFFVVPLNAALQRTGAATVGTGYALAVQNFSENLATIALVGGYALLVGSGLGVGATLLGFGLAVVLAILAAVWLRRALPAMKLAPRA